jgi:hypothetical protein
VPNAKLAKLQIDQIKDALNPAMARVREGHGTHSPASLLSSPQPRKIEVSPLSSLAAAVSKYSVKITPRKYYSSLCGGHTHTYFPFKWRRLRANTNSKTLSANHNRVNAVSFPEAHSAIRDCMQSGRESNCARCTLSVLRISCLIESDGSRRRACRN